VRRLSRRDERRVRGNASCRDVTRSRIPTTHRAILAGYFAGQRLFHAILPDGSVISPQRYVVFSMAEAEISKFLGTNVDDSTDVPAALDLASVAIQMAVSYNHSNDRVSRAVLSPTHMTSV
jgi:hypothetical protein